MNSGKSELIEKQERTITLQIKREKRHEKNIVWKRTQKEKNYYQYKGRWEFYLSTRRVKINRYNDEINQYKISIFFIAYVFKFRYFASCIIDQVSLTHFIGHIITFFRVHIDIFSQKIFKFLFSHFIEFGLLLCFWFEIFPNCLIKVVSPQIPVIYFKSRPTSNLWKFISC